MFQERFRGQSRLFQCKEASQGAILSKALNCQSLRVKWAVKIVGTEIMAYGVLIHTSKQSIIKPGVNVLG